MRARVSAVFGHYAQAEESQFAHLQPLRPRKFVVPIPVGVFRQQFLGGEPAHGVCDELLLVRETEVHGCSAGGKEDANV
jgi:hypothetical protein